MCGKLSFPHKKFVCTVPYFQPFESEMHTKMTKNTTKEERKNFLLQRLLPYVGYNFLLISKKETYLCDKMPSNRNTGTVNAKSVQKKRTFPFWQKVWKKLWVSHFGLFFCKNSFLFLRYCKCIGTFFEISKKIQIFWNPAWPSSKKTFFTSYLVFLIIFICILDSTR